MIFGQHEILIWCLFWKVLPRNLVHIFGSMSMKQDMNTKIKVLENRNFIVLHIQSMITIHI